MHRWPGKDEPFKSTSDLLVVNGLSATGAVRCSYAARGEIDDAHGTWRPPLLIMLENLWRLHRTLQDEIHELMRKASASMRKIEKY